MGNYDQAPTLKHIGEKNRYEFLDGKAIRSHDLEIIMMQQLGAKDFAAFKLMMLLTGNAGDGSFKLPNKTILERCNISKTAYSNARSLLEEKGWIECSQGDYIKVKFDNIYKDGGYDIKSELGVSENTSILDTTQNTSILSSVENTSKSELGTSEDTSILSMSENTPKLSSTEDTAKSMMSYIGPDGNYVF